MATPEPPPSRWLMEKRELNAAAQHVLGKAFDECVNRAYTALKDGDEPKAFDMMLLASIATDIDARKPMVEVIERGLDELGDSWATLAPLVATGAVTQDAADEVVHECITGVLTAAIAEAWWPQILDRDELASLTTLCHWLADEADPPTKSGDDDEDFTD